MTVRHTDKPGIRTYSAGVTEAVQAAPVWASVAAMGAPTIFLSYRREDQDLVLALESELARHFEPEKIFRDVSSIPGGTPFLDALKAALRKTNVVVVLVTKGWVSRFAEFTAEEVDYLRLELVEARAAGVRIIPLRARGAEVPKQELLPPDLHFLLDLQMLNLPEDDGRFPEHVSWLARQIDPARNTRWLKVAAAIVTAAGVLAGAGLWLARSASGHAPPPAAVSGAAMVVLPPTKDSGTPLAVASEAPPRRRAPPQLNVKEVYYALDRQQITRHKSQTSPLLVHDGFFIELLLTTNKDAPAPIIIESLEAHVAQVSQRCPAPPFPLGAGSVTSRRFELHLKGDGEQTVVWRDGKKEDRIKLGSPGGNLLLSDRGMLSFRRIGQAGSLEPNLGPESFSGKVVVTKGGRYAVHFIVRFSEEGQTDGSNSWTSNALHVCH